MKKLKIMMLISRFYPFQAGAEIQCLQLSRQLVKRYYIVSVLTQKIRRLKRYANIDGVHIYRTGFSFENRLGSLTYVISGFIFLWINIKNSDILHVHLLSSPAILAAIITKLFKKPALAKIAGSRTTGDISTSSKTWHGRIKLWIIKKTLRNFVCPSAEIKQELIKAGFKENSISVIPNGVNTHTFTQTSLRQKRPIREKLHLPLDSTIAIYTGRLEPGKEVETLIEAWLDVEADLQISNACLIILGSGSLSEEIRQKAGDYGLRNIIFLDWTSHVAQYLKASDIFVLPSSGEGLPNSLIEAMACGLACISTNIGGIIELITNNRNGILIPPKNAEILTQSLKKLILDASLRHKLGEAAHLFARNNLSIDKVADKYENLYVKIIKNQT